MINGTRLPISLAKKIGKIHKRHYKHNRGWAISNSFVKSTPFEFDYKLYNSKDYSDMWRMNVELHDAMNEYWVDNIGNDAALDEFGRWVIESWGGIRTNKKNTIEHYLYEAKNFNTTDGKKGIASYSKLMAAKDCNKNFILDARVAVALNVLQMEYFAGHRYFFDVQGTQNTEINKFNSVYKRKKYKDIGYKEFNGDMYANFNALILKMAKYLGVRGIEVEMMLFDNATNIISDLDKIELLYQKNLKYWDWRVEDNKRRRLKRHTERLRAQGMNLV